MKKSTVKRLLALAMVVAVLVCSFALPVFAASTYTVTFSTGETVKVNAGENLVFAFTCSPPTDISAITASSGTLTADKTTLGGPSVPQGTTAGLWTLSGITSDVTVTLTLNTQAGATPPTFTSGAEAAAAAYESAASMGAPAGAPPSGAPGAAPTGTPPTGAPGAAPTGAAPTGAAPAGISATPTKSSVLVDGKAVAFDAYTIGGYNYFKLRDLAQAITGSTKQFEVSWDATKNAISLTASKAYTPAGGELAVSTDTTPKSATVTSSKLYLNEKEISLTAYNIGGNNYFKLRDIAAALDFGVTWDSKANSIGIDTTVGYTAE